MFSYTIYHGVFIVYDCTSNKWINNVIRRLHFYKSQLFGAHIPKQEANSAFISAWCHILLLTQSYANKYFANTPWKNFSYFKWEALNG